MTTGTAVPVSLPNALNGEEVDASMTTDTAMPVSLRFSLDGAGGIHRPPRTRRCRCPIRIKLRSKAARQAAKTQREDIRNSPAGTPRRRGKTGGKDQRGDAELAREIFRYLRSANWHDGHPSVQKWRN